MLFNPRWLVCVILLAATPARGQSVSTGCGRDRWPVKTLSDRDAGKVDRTPVRTTIEELSRLPARRRKLPQDGRIAPQELTTYQVQGIVQRIVVEKDRDWHLILADPQNAAVTMTVEIPDPLCVENVEIRDELSEARRDLHTIPRHGLAEVTGVGFFDRVHTKSEHGKNGFELHPVLGIRRF